MRKVRSLKRYPCRNTDRSRASSSLQRIESSNMRLERRFSQIGDFIQKAESGGGGPSGPPTISGIGDRAFKSPIFSAALMKNAEVGQRRWSSIGVDEWIQAGRWWLLKVKTPPCSQFWIRWLIPGSLKVLPPLDPDRPELFQNKAIPILSKLPGY